MVETLRSVMLASHGFSFPVIRIIILRDALSLQQQKIQLAIEKAVTNRI